jgi:hypothetical protein
MMTMNDDHQCQRPYRVLVSGWRRWPAHDAWVVRRSLELIRRRLPISQTMVVVEGQCPHGGVDEYAYQWASGPYSLMRLIVSERHPADWMKLGRAAGPIRNREMVESGINEALVFLGPGTKGTIGCLGMIMEHDIPCSVIAHHPVTIERIRLMDPTVTW